MTEDESDRLLAACRLSGEHEVERDLLHAEIDDVRVFRSGTSETYEVVFEDGSRAAFKSIEGAGKNAAGYNHTDASVLASDYSAWLVARALGWEELVGGVVLTVCSHVGAGLGSLQCWLPGVEAGDSSVTGWDGSAHLRKAALFDALIGQQDRNNLNFNYDSGIDELGLFDNSFAFALPGHNPGSSAILTHVHGDEPVLEPELLEALRRFDSSPEIALLGQVLAPDRHAQLLTRSVEMQAAGQLRPPQTF